MSKDFIKGQAVTFVQDWDRKGTVYFRHAVVFSCGTKQMVLTDAKTGEEMGRHFNPSLGVRYSNEGQTFPRLSDEEAIAVCLKLGAERVQSEKTRLEHCLTLGYSEDYDNATRREIAQLHEPRALDYSNRN